MKENIDKELEQLSPLLHEMRKKSEGFQVPEGYFAQLQANVLEQIKGETPPIMAQTPIPSAVQQKSSWWTQLMEQIDWLLQPRYAVGFASIIFLMAAGWFLLKPSNSDNCNELACVPEDEIQQFLEENMDEIETEQLWKMMVENGVEKTVSVEENKPEKEQNSTLPAKIQNASDEELNEMIDEMIQNGELNEDDLNEIL